MATYLSPWIEASSWAYKRVKEPIHRYKGAHTWSISVGIDWLYIPSPWWFLHLNMTHYASFASSPHLYHNTTTSSLYFHYSASTRHSTYLISFDSSFVFSLHIHHRRSSSLDVLLKELLNRLDQSKAPRTSFHKVNPSNTTAHQLSSNHAIDFHHVSSTATWTLGFNSKPSMSWKSA